jgi:predicted nucleic-acid-binding Zn-ribbon protein
MIPEHGNKKFQCPHCNTVASQEWFTANNAGSTARDIIHHLYLNYRPSITDYAQEHIASFLKEIGRGFQDNFFDLVPKGFSVATCSSCGDFTLWVYKEIVYPKKTTLPPPNEDLNEDIKALYLEASSILVDSPKGATALLRLALQKLLEQVGKSGKNINNDIKSLVAEGLSPKIQQALDLLRVIGNNAVHPGQINLDDNTEIAQKLFGILNFIAEELITKPKELENLYADLIPSDTQDHIKQRDGT